MTYWNKIAQRDAQLLLVELREHDGLALAAIPAGPDLEQRPLQGKLYEEHLTAQGLRDSHPKLERTGWGIELGTEENPRTWSFPVWACDPIDGELSILRLRCHDVEQLEEIVVSARETARPQSLQRLIAWA